MSEHDETAALLRAVIDGIHAEVDNHLHQRGITMESNFDEWQFKRQSLIGSCFQRLSGHLIGAACAGIGCHVALAQKTDKEYDEYRKKQSGGETIEQIRAKRDAFLEKYPHLKRRT